MLKKACTHIYDLWRSKFGHFNIRNPQHIAANAPYTYYLPPNDFIAALAPGDIVKLIFVSIPQSKEYDAERMWLILTERNGDKLLGKLDNDPFDIP